jgi:hypothetical protein
MQNGLSIMARHFAAWLNALVCFVSEEARKIKN